MDIKVITCISSCITLFLTLLITLKIYSTPPEKYKVDISGGFQPPENNCGDCITAFRN
jgi:hypothetical protein